MTTMEPIDASTRISPPAFNGWLRRHAGQKCGRWEIVATGATTTEVSDKLFRMLAGAVGHTDTEILPSGSEP